MNHATITINGQAYTLHFGMLALESFTNAVGKLESESILGTQQAAELVWAGLKNAAYRDRAELSLVFADVLDAVEEKILDDEGQQELLLITSAFNESKAVKMMAERAGEAKKKKKVK